jgi:hypothetical protein
MHFSCPEVRKPDLVLFLTMSPEKCVERIRANRPDEAIEIYENVESLTKISRQFDTVFEKLKDSVSENLFTYEFHREVFKKALELFDSGSAFGITELSHHFVGREGEFSEIFLQTAEIADAKSAAADYIKVIEEETLNIKIAQATESGDVNLLSELLKQQKSLKG